MFAHCHPLKTTCFPLVFRSNTRPQSRNPTPVPPHASDPFCGQVWSICSLPRNLSLAVQPPSLGQAASVYQTGRSMQAVILTSPSPAARLVILTINLIISLCFNSIYRIKTKALKMTHKSPNCVPFPRDSAEATCITAGPNV